MWGRRKRRKGKREEREGEGKRKGVYSQFAITEMMPLRVKNERIPIATNRSEMRFFPFLSPKASQLTFFVCNTIYRKLTDHCNEPFMARGRKHYCRQ